MDETKNYKALLTIVVLVYSVVVAFWALCDNPLDNHECLVSVTTREMLANNNWIIPTFNGEIRLQKTPLSYWLVASVAKVTGAVDEFSTRLPSAVFAVLSAMAILYFTSQWLDFPIAILSAAVWISSLGFIRYSHNGRPEMVLCAMVSISMLSFYAAMESKTRRRQICYMLVFWLSFSLGMLAKGPAPLALLAPPIFLYFVVFKQWNKIKLCLPVIGTILFLIIVLPWLFMIAEKTTGSMAFWKREFLDRFTGDFASGHKPFWYYLQIVFLFAAPFSFFVFYAVAAPFYSIWERKRPVMWYLWLWFVGQVAIMSISGGKRQHYILPAMPAFCILTAIFLYDMIFEQRVFNLKQVKSLFIGHIIVTLAATVGLLYWAFTREKSFIWPSIHISLMLCVLVALVAVLFAQKNKITATVLLFAGYCAVVMIIFIYFLIPMDYNNPSRIFSLKIGSTVATNETLIAYKSVSARTVQYTGRIIPEITDMSDLYKRYEQGQWIIATGNNYKNLIADGRFNSVYYQQIAERSGPRDIEGALFHKN
jgi:4-amino-4-deoxy-L-arabinose transferase-like glycosyltransferase